MAYTQITCSTGAMPTPQSSAANTMDRPCFSHLASLYHHSTPQTWQQKLNNGEVTLNGVTATGSESVASGQTLVWHRPPWIEPDTPQHFEVLFEDPHLLIVNKPAGCPRFRAAASWKTPSCAWCKSKTPKLILSTGWAEPPAASLSSPRHRRQPPIYSQTGTHPKVQKIYRALALNIAQRDAYEILTPIGLVPHPLIGSVWAANPSGKPSKSVAKVISRTANTTTFEVTLHSGRPSPN